MNTEEAFVLASLKEFVKLWGSGSHSFYNLECRNGQAWIKFGSQLGSPGSTHFLHHKPRDFYKKKKKSPSRILKDNARAAAHRLASAATVEVDPQVLPGAQPQVADPATPPPQPETVSPGQVSEPASPSSSPAASASHPVEPAAPAGQPHQDCAEAALEVDQVSTAASAGSTTSKPSPPPTPAAASAVPPQPLPPEEVVVHATAVIDNSPSDTISENDVKSLESLILRENHLKDNISKLEVGQRSSRSFRNNRFKHTIEFLISVKTRKLWDSPKQYIWKHLGQMEWSKDNGTKVSFSRIHVK